MGLLEQRWRNQTISKAGKITLLKTAAQVIPNFWMSLLLIPMDICEEIERKMNAYWWCNGSTNGGIRWIAWDKLCEVKEGGGMGFKKLREFNVAMLAKQGWRLINNTNPLVTSLLKAKYFPHTDFLNAQVGTSPSYVWRSIMEAQLVIKQGCRRKIGNGKSTKVWEVPWLPCVNNGYLTTEMPIELKEATVASLMDENQRQWDQEVLSDICNERDRALIQQIPIPMSCKEDSWFWLPDDTGEFSVRSCYRKLRGEREYAEKSFWKKLWSLNLPGKVINLLWRAARNCLPTACELRTKHVNIESVCSWCQVHMEDAIHVLFTCPFAQEVWRLMGLQVVCTVQQNDTVKDVIKRFFHANSKERCGMVGLICWGLWYRRNKWVWDRANQSAEGVKKMVCSMVTEWKKMKSEDSRLQPQHQGSARVWSKPPEGWIKINVDAACHQESNFVGLGCVIRDDRGRFLRARSNVVPRNMQPKEAEALSLKEAILWTKSWRHTRCIFESDAKLVVDAVNGRIGKSYFDTLVTDCSELIKHFEEVLVVFVHRSANTVAHMLARDTCSMSGLQEWYHTAPASIACNLVSEEY